MRKAAITMLFLLALLAVCCAYNMTYKKTVEIQRIKKPVDTTKVKKP